MFGINSSEFIILLIVAALVLGPKNIAQAIRGLRSILKQFRRWSAQLRADTSVDLGSIAPEDIEQLRKLRSLDLSSYNPKTMIRQTVQEELDAWLKSAGSPAQFKKDNAPANTGSELTNPPAKPANDGDNQ